MVYNTKYQCTYHLSEVFTDSDNINENDKYFVREAIYRQDLLNVFGIDEYNEQKINNEIHEIYEKVKDSKEIMQCGIKLASQFLSEDYELGLTMLFAYDYMYLTHLCISEFLEMGQISEKNVLKLKSVVF